MLQGLPKKNVQPMRHYVPGEDMSSFREREDAEEVA